MVDLLLVTTIGANLATIIALIISIISLRKEVTKYANNFQNMQQSIIEYISKVEIRSEQKIEVNVYPNVADVTK